MYEPLEKKIKSGKIGFYHPTGEKLDYTFSEHHDPWNHFALDKFIEQEISEIVMGGKCLQKFLCWGKNIRGVADLIVQMSYQRGLYPIKINANFDYLKTKRIWVPRKFDKLCEQTDFPNLSSFETTWYCALEDAKDNFGRSHGPPKMRQEWESAIADFKIYFPFGDWLGRS